MGKGSYLTVDIDNHYRLTLVALRAETCNYIQGVALGLTEFLHALNFRYVLCNIGGELVVSRYKGSIVQCKKSKNHENGA
jgi:hypothetical protein